MATKIRPFNLHTDTETRIQTLAGNLIDSAYVNARVSWPTAFSAASGQISSVSNKMDIG